MFAEIPRQHADEFHITSFEIDPFEHAISACRTTGNVCPIVRHRHCKIIPWELHSEAHL